MIMWTLVSHTALLIWCPYLTHPHVYIGISPCISIMMSLYDQSSCQHTYLTLYDVCWFLAPQRVWFSLNSHYHQCQQCEILRVTFSVPDWLIYWCHYDVTVGRKTGLHTGNEKIVIYRIKSTGKMCYKMLHVLPIRRKLPKSNPQ